MKFNYLMNHYRVGCLQTNETESRRDVDPLEVDDANEEIKVEKEEFSVKPSEEYQCDFCAAIFATKRSIRNHILQKHKEKTLKCSECEKCFQTKSILTNHMRTHSNERPYKCEVGNKEE